MLPKRSPSRWWLGSTKRFYAVRMGAANRERGSNYAGHRGGSTIQPQWQEGGLARGEFPAAPDVIYRNPEAVQNRLRLYHLLRLQNQVRLDAENLSSKSFFQVRMLISTI